MFLAQRSPLPGPSSSPLTLRLCAPAGCRAGLRGQTQCERRQRTAAEIQLHAVPSAAAGESECAGKGGATSQLAERQEGSASCPG